MNPGCSNTKLRALFRFCLLSLCAFVFAACATESGVDVTSKETSALVSSTDILGFESPSNWQAGVALTRVNTHSQGSFSLGVAARGYVPITSVPLPPPVKVDSVVSVDLFLPTAQANPNWFGALQMFFNSPSSNIYNAYIGQVELTGLPTGSFQTLSLKVPDDVRARVRQNATDFTVTVVINVPINAPGTYLLDRLVLATAVAACNSNNNGSACDDANPCTSGDKCQSGVCRGTAVDSCVFDPAAGTATISWNKPAVLNAYRPSCTNPGDAIEFQHTVQFPIPPSITVKGTAAITAELKLVAPFHPAVTCNYSAPTSSNSNPRQAAFTSCSDGSTPGAVLKAASYSLRVVSASGVPATGDGICSHSAASAQVSLSSDEMPILPEPLSAAETTALRTSFSWPATQAVTELDDQGRPLLYYALVLLENVQQRKFLDDLKIHNDMLPIFEGLERWRGMRGMFVHHGDGTGVYTYALMMGAQFNYLRAAALAGNVVFRAVNLIPMPARFANPDGKTASYKALANAGFRYRGVAPGAPLAPILCSGDLGGPIRDVVQGGAELFHDAENFISGLFGDAAGAVVGTVPVHVHMRPFITDPTFNDIQNIAVTPAQAAANVAVTGQAGIVKRQLRSAWGPVPGFPASANGARVAARGVSFPSYREATLSNDSDASIEFNKGLDTAFCFYPKNGFADVIDWITTVEECDFGVLSTETSVRYEFNVANDVMNVFATLSDNGNFSDAILGFAPEQEAKTLVGHYADLVPNAITPCFSKNNAASGFMATLVSAWAAIQETVKLDLASAAELALLGSCVYEVDMVIPSEEGAARSRGVTSHEYGHWMMCDLLGDAGVNTTYNAAILETLSLTQPVETLGECNQACGNEAFADAWSAQVVGGSTYFAFNNQIADIAGYTDDGKRKPTMVYCPSTANQCFDDNVGGPNQLSGNQGTRANNKGRTTSIIHDFLDGVLSLGSHTFTNGNYWKTTPTLSTLTQFDMDARAGGTLGDELISLSGNGLAQAILHRRGISIDQDALFGGFSDTAYDEGANWCQLCKLFANHNMGECTQVAGEPVCTPSFCTGGGTACTQAEENEKLFSLCARSSSITRWIGPRDSTTPGSCAFIPSTTCPPGQIVSTIGTCIVPPCAGGQVLERDGTCQDSCTPQDVDGVMTPTPIGNGRCLILVS